MAVSILEFIWDTQNTQQLVLSREYAQQLGIQKARQTRAKWPHPAYKAKRGPLLRFPSRLAVAIAATNRVAVKKAEEKKGKSYPPSQPA
jgi:hypothetical protein